MAVCALAMGAAACSTDTTGLGRTDGDLVFARFSATAQTQASTKSFWAVKGQDRTLEMRYQPTSGQSEGDQFLQFRVKPSSLLLHPNGTPFLNGDSVLITVTADPQQRFIFTFEPSGLTFSPIEPAELRIEYDKADDDLNHDGHTDSKDAELKLKLQVWQRQSPGLPWVPLPTLRVQNTDEVRGTITHFTSFALAS